MPNFNNVYLHRKADTGEVFYVGIGGRGRANSMSGRTAHWRNIVAKHGLKIDFVFRDVPREEAVEAEVFLIDWIGRQVNGSGPLINITDGGEGCPGRDKGKRLSADHRAKLAAAKVGTKQSVETVQKRISKTRGLKRTQEQRQALRAIALIRAQSEDYRKKLSLANTGKMASAQARLAMSNARRGVPNKSLHKRICCLETQNVFESLKSAADWVIASGLTHSSRGANSLVSACANGKVKSAYGYRWAYEAANP